MLRVETSPRVKSACIIVLFGTCVSSMGYLSFSLVGAFYAVAWPTVISIYGIYLKKTLTSLKNDFWYDKLKQEINLNLNAIYM